MSIRLVEGSPCDGMVRRLDEYVDRSLSPRERLRQIDVPHDLMDNVTRRLAAEG